MASFNLIDAAIAFVSPQRGLARTSARLKNEILKDSLRKYDGASGGRRTDDWVAHSTSANTETKAALEKLRNRSRDMVRNNTYAKTAIDVICTNVVGSGIRATIQGEDKNTNDSTMQHWNGWADSTYCDFDGKLNFYGLQELVMRSIAESGECIILRKLNNEKKRISLQVQVLEADYLYPYNETLDTKDLFPKKGKGNVIIQGVEFNPQGKRIAYWLFNQHPGDYQGTSLKPVRVDAKNVLHCYQIIRPGQVRGIPFGASALMQLKDLQDFQDAELTKQKIASCLTVFITEPEGDVVASSPQELEANKKKKEKRLERIEPGIIEHLSPGKEVHFATPPTNTGYPEYTKRILQSIATGFGITYEALTSDLSMVNFSSGRMGWLEFYRRIQSWQLNTLIPGFCEGVWEWFMQAGELGGQVKKQATAEWTPARREMIDPVKEVKGIKMAIRAGLLTWQEAVRQQGYDPKTQLTQIVKDFKDFDSNKVILDIDARQDIAPKKDITG